MMYTKEMFIQQYHNLSQHPDKVVRDQANDYILAFKKSTEAWAVSRQLIIEMNQSVDMQQLGAQILYRKIKEEYFTLSTEQRSELRDYVFSFFNTDLKQFCVGTIKSLCSAAALIGMFNYCTVWQTFLDDIIKFMQQSQSHFEVGLEILQNIAIEIRLAVTERKVQMKIRDTFLQEKEKIIQIFYSVLILNNPAFVLKCLQCIYEWVQPDFKLQILEDEQMIQQLIKLMDGSTQSATTTSSNQQQPPVIATAVSYFEMITQIFVEAINNSNYADMHTSYNQQHNGTSAILQNKEMLNIKAMLVFFYNAVIQQSTANVKNFKLSKALAECTTQIGIKFPIIFLEDATTAKNVLNLLLHLAEHPNRKISVITFDFWVHFKDFFKQNINDNEGNIIDSQNKMFKQCCIQIDDIIQLYFQLLKIVIEKCKLSKLVQNSTEFLNKNINAYVGVSTQPQKYQLIDYSSQNQQTQKIFQDNLFNCCNNNNNQNELEARCLQRKGGTEYQTDSDNDCDSQDTTTDLSSSKMSTYDYRNFAQDVITSIYCLMQEYKGNEGQCVFFQYISELMDCNVQQQNPTQQQQQPLAISQPQISEQQTISIEVGLFVLNQVIEFILFKESNPFIKNVLLFILSERFPQHNMILQQAIHLIYECANELKVSPELFDLVVQFLLRNVQHPTLCDQAANLFQELIVQFEEHDQSKSLPAILNFILQHYSHFRSEKVNQCLFQGVTQFVINTKNMTEMAASLQVLIGAIEQKIQEEIAAMESLFKQQQGKLSAEQLHSEYFQMQVIQHREKELNQMLQTVTSVMVGLDYGREQNQTAVHNIIQKHCANFIDKNINFFNQIFEILCLRKIQASTDTNNTQIVNDLNKFLRFFKYIIKICGDNLPAGYVQFLNTSLKILQVDPKKNASALNIFSQLLQTLTTKNAILEKWIQENFESFNVYMLGILMQKDQQDPDLIKLYVQILKNILLFNEEIFLAAQSYLQIMDFVLICLVHINSYDMTREIMNFLGILITAKKCINNQLVTQHLLTILNGILFIMPKINRTLITPIAQIITYYMMLYSQNMSSLLESVFSNELFKVFSVQQKKVIIKAIMQYGKNDQNNLKKLLGELVSQLNQLGVSQQYFINLEIQISRQENNIMHQQQQQQLYMQPAQNVSILNQNQYHNSTNNVLNFLDQNFCQKNTI